MRETGRALFGMDRLTRPGASVCCNQIVGENWRPLNVKWAVERVARAQSNARARTKMETVMMRAAALAAPGCFVIQDVPVPEPAPEEVRVRLEGCGVCGSNLAPFEGRPWFEY